MVGFAAASRNSGVLCAKNWIVLILFKCCNLPELLDVALDEVSDMAAVWAP